MFFSRETPAQKQAKLDAALAKRLAREKAWKVFWFKVKLIIGGGCIAVVTMCAGLIYFGPRSQPGSYVVSPAPSAVSQSLASQPHLPQPAASEPIAPIESLTPRTKAKVKNGEFKESKAEKLKEWWTGKEIVHKKDGTTYERSKPK